MHALVTGVRVFVGHDALVFQVFFFALVSQQGAARSNDGRNKSRAAAESKSNNQGPL